jgi:hypothetical protein
MAGERTRLIKIRVSEQDFQALNEVCQQNGMKAIGDLAREEMYHLVDTYQATTLKGADTRLWFRELISRLTSLQAEIERLEELLKLKR